MELKVIVYAVKDGIATVTLNRPQRRNSWTGRMHAEYRWVLEQAEQDPAVRAIIVTGAGDAFCVGAGPFERWKDMLTKVAMIRGTPDEMATPGYGVRPEFDADFAVSVWHGQARYCRNDGSAAGVGLVMACYAEPPFCCDRG